MIPKAGVFVAAALAGDLDYVDDAHVESNVLELNGVEGSGGRPVLEFARSEQSGVLSYVS